MCLEVSEVTLQIYGRDSKARLNGEDPQRGETQDGKNLPAPKALVPVTPEATLNSYRLVMSPSLPSPCTQS